MSDQKPPPPGVSEEAKPFRASDDDWAIARDRYEEHLRTGETISVEEYMEELRRAVDARRAEKR